ncbi:Sortase family protein [Marinobacterium sp. xm-g-59]|uniref:class GN sortase n=1 Tax=Marinobacterium sp. xm-g-59 TaxID=2497748 RepID=UPI0015694A2B|nr:class GN sortase [Marinobacterium sp. xm-g-59]NRP96186.1 Sortase family protein [Marinobacterium sp. xm-g-59]
MNSRMKRRVGYGLIAGAFVLLIDALWIPAKAQVAQLLLDAAWEVTQLTGEPQQPWPWADHYPVARFSAPAFDVDHIVLAGDSGSVLAFAPGENLEAKSVEGGARIISAHRDTHFRFLKHISLGDELVLEDEQGVQHFKVVNTDVVDSKTSRIKPATNPNGLFLVTCYPFDALSANGDERFVVTAVPIETNALL